MNRLIQKDVLDAVSRLTGTPVKSLDPEQRLRTDLGLNAEGIARVLRQAGQRWGYTVLYKEALADNSIAELIAYLTPFALRSIDERVRECLAPDDAEELSGLEHLGDDLLLDDYNCLFLAEKLEEEFELSLPEGAAADMPGMTVDEVSAMIARCMETGN